MVSVFQLFNLVLLLFYICVIVINSGGFSRSMLQLPTRVTSQSSDCSLLHFVQLMTHFVTCGTNANRSNLSEWLFVNIKLLRKALKISFRRAMMCTDDVTARAPHWSRHIECSVRGGISGVATSRVKHSDLLYQLKCDQIHTKLIDFHWWVTCGSFTPCIGQNNKPAISNNSLWWWI